MNVEEAIQKFAKARRVKDEDFPAFRERILEGLVKLGLSTSEIDMEKYKKVIK